MTEAADNVALALWDAAENQPDSLALADDRTGLSVTFEALHRRTAALAAGLAAHGVKQGDAVVVMLRPGFDFVATAFAVVALGASVVVVDPGLGLRRMMSAFASVPVQAVIAERVFHLASVLFRPFRGKVLRVSRGAWPGARSLDQVAASGAEVVFAVEPSPRSPAVMAFTSGATGRSKSVIMAHGTLRAQIDAIREMARVGRGDVQLAFLPLAALMGPGLQCATVFPDMNASRVRSVRGEAVVGAIRRWGVSHAIASPFIWQRVAEALDRNPEALPTLRKVFVGGAPAPESLLARLRALFTAADVHIGYGSTEVVPITAASSPLPPGTGAPVGKTVPGLELRLIEPFGAEARELDDCVEVANGQVGEVIVKGDRVSSGYGDPAASAITRIVDGEDIWHRVGDVGVLDDAGCLWLYGRRDEVVNTPSGPLYPGVVEPLFDGLPDLERAVLVGVGTAPSMQAVVIGVPKPGVSAHTLLAAMARHARDQEATRSIDRFLIRREVPVDPRHHAKILRGELAAWAKTRVPVAVLQ